MEVEAARLRILKAYDVLDTPAEQLFDDITELAATICDTPIALVSLVDSERQWFKSKYGLTVDQTDRRYAFCAHAIETPDQLFVVPDAAADPRFADNPLVTGEPFIRFYAGAPIVVPGGYALGTVCAIDTKPRELSDAQLKSLRTLAHQVAAILEYRAMLGELDTYSAGQEGRMASLLSAVRFGILFEDTRRRIDYVNPALRRIWNIAPTVALAGMETSEFLKMCSISATDPAHFSSVILRPPGSRDGGSRAEVQLSDGRTLTQTNHPVVDTEGRFSGQLWVYEDITHQKQTAERLVYLAERDSLTGLANRHRFQDELHRMVSNAKRHERAAAIIFFDLDEFKIINDSFGHGAGDTLLVRIASEIRTIVRRGETFARLGGDEFAILVPDAKADDVVKLAERVVRTVAGIPFQTQGRTMRVTASVGIALYPDHGAHPEDLVAHADSAMYMAKEAGKNTWRLYRPEHDSSRAQLSRISWNDRLMDAIESERLVLHYQGVHNADGSLSHVEALARLNEPSGLSDLTLPGTFIKEAERAGLIIDVDRYVLEKAISVLACYAALPAISVNLSARSFETLADTGFVRSTLAKHGVAPERLIIELTESAAVADIQDARRLVEVLHALGCQVHLDDFGTGFSSFAYLLELRADVIKIDGMFVHDVASRPESRVLVKSMVDVGRGLGMGVIAEHARDPETVSTLLELGIDLLQGHHFSIPTGDLDALLADHS